MSDEEEVQRRQLESMTTEQITVRIKENWREMDTFIDQLAIRASIQVYTEQQYNELLILVQEAVTYIEEAPSTLEWVGRRNELLAKFKKKVGRISI